MEKCKKCDAPIPDANLGDLSRWGVELECKNCGPFHLCTACDLDQEYNDDDFLKEFGESKEKFLKELRRERAERIAKLPKENSLRP